MKKTKIEELEEEIKHLYKVRNSHLKNKFESGFNICNEKLNSLHSEIYGRQNERQELIKMINKIKCSAQDNAVWFKEQVLKEIENDKNKDWRIER